MLRRTARSLAEVEVDTVDQSTLLAALLVRTRPPSKEREAGVDLVRRLHVSPRGAASPAAPVHAAKAANGARAARRSRRRCGAHEALRSRLPLRRRGAGARAMERRRGTSASWPRWRCTRGTRGSWSAAATAGEWPPPRSRPARGRCSEASPRSSTRPSALAAPWPCPSSIARSCCWATALLLHSPAVGGSRWVAGVLFLE